MKTTKEQRSMFRKFGVHNTHTASALCDDADEAERLEAENAECMRVLRYLMQQFDSETWFCPTCGHSESTSDMDSASFLREWLNKKPRPIGLEAEVAKLRKSLEAFETCVKRLYHDAID